MTDITQLIATLERDSGGTIYAALHDLQTDEWVTHRGDQTVATASVVKLPILVYIAMEVAAGRLAWDTRLTLTDAEKVGGSGVLQGISAGTQLTIHDLCYLMTVVSDNTATNLLIEHVGVAAVNQRMRELGLPITELFRKVYGPDTPRSEPYGLGMTTAWECAQLLTLIAQRQVGPASEPILALLAGQQDLAAIPRLLPADWKYAGKTGAISRLRADIGIVTAPDGRQFALALFCWNLPRIDWTVENAGLIALARLARALLPIAA